MSLPEVSEHNIAVIVPAIGSEFYLNSEYENKVSSISLYDSEGKLSTICVLQTGAPLFNATPLPDSVYMARIKFMNGNMNVQKLIIKK